MIREKVIFDGLIDGTKEAVEVEVEKFRFETFVAIDIDMKIETEDNKQLWVIYAPLPTETSRIINGFIEINPLFLTPDSHVRFRVVSCREELDILFFQLSQRVQARFIIPELTAELIALPWRELVEKKVISQASDNPHDVIYSPPNPDETVKKFGTDGDLTKNDVRRLVNKCRAYMKNGGTIRAFYDEEMKDLPCSFQTFRGWMKNKEFNKP